MSLLFNGLEYAESNYRGYGYCWTWLWYRLFYDYPSMRTKQVNGNTQYYILPEDWDLVAYGDGYLTFREIGDWMIFLRCPCGVGYSPRHPMAIVDRWLCKECGRGNGTLVKWIGRRIANRWQWKPESELPADLTPKDLTPDSRPNNEFEARVKAAVEVELASRMATMERK